MTNIPPTKKEQMLMKVLVKRFSKEQLYRELVDIQSQGMTSNYVQSSAIFLGINVPKKIDSQYLNYAVNNYQEIKNNYFPDEFERMTTLEVEVFSKEIRVVNVTYQSLYPVLKSFSDELKKDIHENIWDYDPEWSDEDTVASDTEDSEISIEETSDPWQDNVIR